MPKKAPFESFNLNNFDIFMLIFEDILLGALDTYTKNINSNTNITLIDDSKIINDPKDVCCILNQYFVNVTRSISMYDPIIETILLTI